jgi:hypothetical protein
VNLPKVMLAALSAILHVASATSAETTTPSIHVSCETARNILRQAEMLDEKQSCAIMQQIVPLAISKLDAEKAVIALKQNNIAQEMLSELWKDKPETPASRPEILPSPRLFRCTAHSGVSLDDKGHLVQDAAVRHQLKHSPDLIFDEATGDVHFILENRPPVTRRYEIAQKGSSVNDIVAIHRSQGNASLVLEILRISIWQEQIPFAFFEYGTLLAGQCGVRKSDTRAASKR